MIKKDTAAVPIEQISSSILFFRGQRVLLDSDLAALYGVTTKRFNEQVRRNLARFPADFMFQLTAEEVTGLRSQIATSNVGRGGRRYAPYAFTEHGAIMAATILNSPLAVEMSVYVVRAFVQLRDMLASNKELARRLDELERKLQSCSGGRLSLIIVNGTQQFADLLWICNRGMVLDADRASAPRRSAVGSRSRRPVATAYRECGRRGTNAMRGLALPARSVDDTQKECRLV